MEMRTVSVQDAEFQSLLDGRFSTTLRALPMRSLNVNTAREAVTFKIVPLDKLKRPAPGVLFWRLLRAHTLTLSLGPLLATWLYLVQSGTVFESGWNVFLALGGAFCFHISLNLISEYHDHMRGQDRVNAHSGSRVIQSGWVRAIQVRRLAGVFLFLAIAAGLPLILQKQVLWVMVAAAALAIAYAFAAARRGLKYRGWGEVIVFLLSGPLLTAGFALATTSSVSWDVLSLGLIFGAVSAFHYHMTNLENIMVDSQAGVRTLSSWLGFDRSKRVLSYMAVFSVFTWLVLAVQWGGVIWLPAAALQAAVLFYLVWYVYRLPSPLSSGFRHVRRWGLILHGLTTFLLIGTLLCL